MLDGRGQLGDHGREETQAFYKEGEGPCLQNWMESDSQFSHSSLANLTKKKGFCG